MSFSTSTRIRIAILILCGCAWLANSKAFAADSGGRESHFDVRRFQIEGKTLLATNVLAPIFSNHTGTNVTVEQLVRAAAEVQAKYRAQGYPGMSVVIGPRRIINGVVTMNVFEGDVPQIVVSGQRYLISSNRVSAVSAGTPKEVATTPEPEETTTSTNTGPRFEVEKYLISGNSVLSPAALAEAVTNTPGAFGTNVTFGGIQSALVSLQDAYRARGYVTVSVGLPRQKLTNATVNVKVTEGRLGSIRVAGNHYFSSNNVMRSLPSLHTNTILNGLVFQAELNRANANQDRQIYPVIGPGAEPATSDLTLKVKDRLPVHGKIGLNNQNSPGTPDLRVNTSAVYNNLWQHEHSLGVQYNFSPEAYKQGDQWDFFDKPLVATYSAFYRLPLGNPSSIADAIASQPGTFGYNEATRRFNLPPPSGRPELTLYGSRATIDTGLQALSTRNLATNLPPDVKKMEETIVQQDLTLNDTLGFRLSETLCCFRRVSVRVFAGNRREILFIDR